MNTMKLARYNKLSCLKRISRTLLEEFLARYAADLHHTGWTLPPPGLSDDAFLQEVAHRLMSPGQLPDSLNDALVVLDEMSAPRAFQQLESAADWPRLQSVLKPESTREEIVLQLWLREQQFLTKQHNALRLKRLTAFEYAGTRVPRGQRPAFESPDKLIILQLTQSLDAWFARNQRGAETTRIEVYPIGHDYYFLIRHADIFTRMPKVLRQETQFLHFHPERDDVVVLSPRLDEIRVNARTRSERNLYFAEFGAHLRGDAKYFSERAPYTLEPLRHLTPDCLKPREIPGLHEARLRELQVAYDSEGHEIITRSSTNLFDLEMVGGHRPIPIPGTGRIVRAVFEMQFAASKRLYPVEVRLPNMMKVSRHCDFPAIQAWVCATGIRVGETKSGETLIAA
jgi:hypothetical protein